MNDQQLPRYDADQAKKIANQYLQEQQERISIIKRLLGFGTCIIKPMSDENVKHLAAYKPHGRKQDEG